MVCSFYPLLGGIELLAVALRRRLQPLDIVAGLVLVVIPLTHLLDAAEVEREVVCPIFKSGNRGSGDEVVAADGDVTQRRL